MEKNEILYAYIGGAGICQLNLGVGTGGFNGGGNSIRIGSVNTIDPAQSGGGATDFSTYGTDNSTAWNFENHFYSRIIVAGGGGGGSMDGSSSAPGRGGHGGGSSGIQTDTSYASYKTGLPGTQINGNAFGYGYSAPSNYSGTWGKAGGGGGWYGGYATSGVEHAAAGGGSGWVYTAATYAYWAANSTEGKSGKWKLDPSHYLTSAQTIAGNASMPNISGTGNETGHSGNGYARITWVGDTI